MVEALLRELPFWLPYLPYLLFALLLLAGINIPISEDLLLLTGGMLACRYMPEKALWIYGWLFAGCLISAWEAYAIGRFFGPKLFKIRWLRHIVTENRVSSLNRLLERFGLFVFFIGRFVPGGFRNALFMSSGLCKMPFSLFLLRDSFACLLASGLIFLLGFKFGEHYEDIIHYMKTYNKIVLLIILISLSTLYLFLKQKRKIKVLN